MVRFATTVVMLTLTLVCTRCAAAGDVQPAAPTYVTFTGDNDFFAGYDHHYTNGFQFAMSADQVALPRFVRSLPPLRGHADPHITFSIGQRIYTPSDKGRSEPDPHDRPYAGWLYALGEVRVRSGDAVESLQASVGLIGPAALARQTQNTYHRMIGAQKAQGWGSQLDNQIGVLLGYERAWPGLRPMAVGPLTADVTPKIGATVGNVYTYANAGVVLRLGHKLPDDFPVTGISLGPPRDGYRPSRQGFGWYAWAGTEARAVAWNTFVDRSPGITRKPFGHDLQFGIAAVWGSSRLGFTFVQRSREFDSQADNDRFGQLTYSFGV